MTRKKLTWAEARERAAVEEAQCSVCPARFEAPSALARHVNEAHPTAWQYEAPPAMPGAPKAPKGFRVYLRVSTDDQVNVNQEIRVRQWMELRGFIRGDDWRNAKRAIVRLPSATVMNGRRHVTTYGQEYERIEGHGFVVYGDHESGGHMNRPGFQTLLRELQPGEAVVVLRADRLSRSLSDFVNVTRYIHSRGGEIACVEQPLDTTTPMGMAFWQVLGVFAELERALIVARTRDGLARARAAGKRLGRHPRGCGLAYKCPWGVDHTRVTRHTRFTLDGQPVPKAPVARPVMSRTKPGKRLQKTPLPAGTPFPDENVPGGATA